MGLFREALNNNKFVLTVEVSPPKGVITRPILDVISSVKDKIDGVNVTDNQRAVMRMSALAFSHLLVQEGIDPILQICSRDRNRIALQSDVLGAYSLGIKNLCVMTGDHCILGDHPDAKSVFDLDSIQIIQMIKDLENGNNLMGKPISGSPVFLIGSVANPFYNPFELQLLKLKKKIDSGAEFIQTQPFFDKKSVEIFLKRVNSYKAKYLIGIVPLKSVRMIDFMNKKVLTTPIPDEVAKRMENSEDQVKEGIKIAVEFIEEIREMVDGVHIMAIGLNEYLSDIIDNIN